MELQVLDVRTASRVTASGRRGRNCDLYRTKQPAPERAPSLKQPREPQGRRGRRNRHAGFSRAAPTSWLDVPERTDRAFESPAGWLRRGIRASEARADEDTVRRANRYDSVLWSRYRDRGPRRRYRIGGFMEERLSGEGRGPGVRTAGGFLTMDSADRTELL
jgi:hypothetical protein